MDKDRLIIPAGYSSRLNILETEVAIKLVKDTFERELAEVLRLTRVSAPLFVRPSSGLNDDLNGIERPVQFDMKDLPEDVQIVQSLAKWKRMALHRYGIEPGKGLYTDMNAVRRDEDLDNLHSAYVDQWDWELVITKEQRCQDFLKGVVERIVAALWATQQNLCAQFPGVDSFLTRELTWMTSQELEDRYPALSPYERECHITRERGTVFLSQIGGVLRSGERHDGRAPDYDDWTMNGDILVWNPVLGRVFEISSMGVRVDAATLRRQLAEAGCPEREKLPFHRMLLEGRLPLTIGGGIGQSRICMLLLQKAHIGEVQASEWPQEMIDACAAGGVHLL